MSIRKLEPALAIELIRRCLTDDLRKPRYRGHPNKYRGHCYVASEALYHLISRKHGFKPHYTKLTAGETHWFLMTPTGQEILDPTWDQFNISDRGFWLYTEATPCGFLTKKPSKRAQELISRVRREFDSLRTHQ